MRRLIAQVSINSVQMFKKKNVRYAIVRKAQI